MLELNNIIKASEGKDQNGSPKSSFSVMEQIIDASDDIKTLKEHVFIEPEIKFVLNGDYVVIDFIFPSVSSTELRVLWNFLEKFGEKQNEYFDKDEAPILEFTILPLEFSGKYFYSLINPIYWTLQPSAPGSVVNTIRLLFELKALNIFESNGVDEKEVESELEKEEYENERLEEIERKKQEEHDEYLDGLNKRFENRR